VPRCTASPWPGSTSQPTVAGDTAQASLATVLGYLGTDVVEPACLRIPVARDAVDARGVIADDGIRQRLSEVLDALLAHLAAD
jgi:chromate reductase